MGRIFDALVQASLFRVFCPHQIIRFRNTSALPDHWES